MGPKVLDVPTFEQAASYPRESGIRRDSTGGWSAIRNGRLVDSFTGPGCKGRAIQAAGSNRVLA